MKKEVFKDVEASYVESVNEIKKKKKCLTLKGILDLNVV